MSGMFSAEPLLCAIGALGHDRIMLATDYPFEPLDEASEFIDRVALAEDARADIWSGNARRLLRLAEPAA
jgi:2,3-dihydroxybenzoate decarboxylase